MTRKIIPLRGFLVECIHTPSEALVTKRFSDDDEEIVKEIDKVLFTLPKEYANRFVAIRSFAHQRLIPQGHYGRKIGMSEGRFIWFIPPEKMIPLRLAFAETVLKDLKKLQDDIHDYIESNPEKLKQVQRYIEMKKKFQFTNIRDYLRQRTGDLTSPSRASIDFDPIGFDMAQFEESMDTRHKQQIQEEQKRRAALTEEELTRQDTMLKKERAQSERLRQLEKTEIQRMKKETQVKQKEILQSTVLEVQKDIAEIYNQLTPELAKKNPQKFKEKLAEAQATAQSYGIEELLASTIKGVSDLVEAYSNPSAEPLIKAVEAIKDHYQIAEANPEQILKQAARHLNKELSPEARAILAEFD